MRIESVSIENYKVFKRTTIKDLHSMVVLLGANGSGKSAFFDVFGFFLTLSHFMSCFFKRVINRYI